MNKCYLNTPILDFIFYQDSNYSTILKVLKLLTGKSQIFDSTKLVNNYGKVEVHRVEKRSGTYYNLILRSNNMTIIPGNYIIKDSLNHIEVLTPKEFKQKYSIV